MLLFKADYRKYPIPLLEKMRFDEEEFYKKYDKCVLIQTCNRIEIYFDNHCIDKKEEEELAKDFKCFDILTGKEAIIHLLRVSCGLESMIVGEDQILGQIKKSYIKARELKKTTKYLDNILLKSIHVGQRVRKETKINEGGVSVGSAAVELVEKTVGLSEKKVLLVGAGEIGTLVAKALIEKNIKAIIVANRTYERAERLSKELKGMAVHFDKLKEAINFSDIVICATASPHYILEKKDLEDVGEKVIVDIANPRDVKDDVKELDNIKLYTIDDLRLVSDENLKKRKSEIPKVEKIIEEEYELLVSQFEKMKVEDIVKDFNSYIEYIREKELQKALKMLNCKNPEKVLEDFSKAFAKRIIHDFVHYSYCVSKDDLTNSMWWKNGKRK